MWLELARAREDKVWGYIIALEQAPQCPPLDLNLQGPILLSSPQVLKGRPLRSLLGDTWVGQRDISVRPPSHMVNPLHCLQPTQTPPPITFSAFANVL